jgi:hypothetical protein
MCDALRQVVVRYEAVVGSGAHDAAARTIRRAARRSRRTDGGGTNALPRGRLGPALSGFTFGKGAVVARIYDKTLEMSTRGTTLAGDGVA